MLCSTGPSKVFTCERPGDILTLTVEVNLIPLPPHCGSTRHCRVITPYHYNGDVECLHVSVPHYGSTRHYWVITSYHCNKHIPTFKKILHSSKTFDDINHEDFSCRL